VIQDFKMIVAISTTMPTGIQYSIIPKTHDPDSRNRRHQSTPFFWRQFLVRVSCISGTGFVWYQIPAPIRSRTLLYSKPESGVHVTEMIIYDLCLFNLPLATIPAIIIAAASANSSSVSLSVTFIFGARNFHSKKPKTGARKWGRSMALVSASCVMGTTAVVIEDLYSV